jgi:hypothetical protein
VSVRQDEGLIRGGIAAADTSQMISGRRPRLGRLVATALGLLVLAPGVAAIARGAVWPRSPHATASRPAAVRARSPRFSRVSVVDDQKRVCVYDDNSISALTQFAALAARHTIDCAQVYGASENWAAWADPWFTTSNDPNLNWGAWVRHSPADDRRLLIITQELVPTDLGSTDWLQKGAAGDYAGYARTLARRLVAAGLSDSVIRLAPEMNGNWYDDNVPDTPGGDREWIAFWRRTVTAMRSVPGAQFVFDWCPNNGYRAIPLRDYYPGNDYVDVIGDDAYDSGVPRGVTDRWQYIYDRPDGLHAILDFAQAHDKPFSLPEWGVGPGGTSYLAGGDDASYVRGLAAIVAQDDVAFQAYFFRYGWETELRDGPSALRAYRAAFGTHGYADEPDAGADAISLRTPARERARRAARR